MARTCGMVVSPQLAIETAEAALVAAERSFFEVIASNSGAHTLLD
jgi:hypothetical protein